MRLERRTRNTPAQEYCWRIRLIYIGSIRPDVDRVMCTLFPTIRISFLLRNASRRNGRVLRECTLGVSYHMSLCWFIRMILNADLMFRFVSPIVSYTYWYLDVFFRLRNSYTTRFSVFCPQLGLLDDVLENEKHLLITHEKTNQKSLYKT